MEWEVPESTGAEDASQRRRHPRFVLTPPLELRIYGDPRPASIVRLINISRSGAAIFAEYLLGEPGMRLVLEMRDHVGSEGVTLPCHVLWALGEKDPPSNQNPRWLHGAAFVDIDARALRLVGNLIRTAGGASS